MDELEVITAGESVMPGEAFLGDTPLLRSHAGTQPDLFLRWNEISLTAPAVDVVVHLHGFSQQQGAMALAEKVSGSGLDLTGRRRPTIALLPRGNWLRYTWYDFPALLAGGIDRLIEYGVERFAEAAGLDRLAVDRFILTAHSGGGMPAIDAIAGASQLPDEFYVFDGL
jgi:pimeloyl-ACP methyl ester carboxylesterase